MTWIHALSKTCSTHKANLDWYCADHMLIGCNRCIFKEHRRCDVVMTSQEYCEKEKKKNNLSLHDMDKSLEKAFDCIKLMTEACDARDGSLKQNQDVCLKSISAHRQQINAYLDTQQGEITQELISKHKAAKAQVDVFRQICNRLGCAIQSTIEGTKAADQRGDHTGMIQLFHRGQIEIGACNNLIDYMSSKPVCLKHEIDTKLTTMDQSGPLCLGRIIAEKQPCALSCGVEFVENKTMLSYRRVKKLRQFVIRIPSDRDECGGHGVLLMVNGNVVVSDYNNQKLKLFSLEGQCLNELEINGYPRDMTLIDENTLAVTVSSSKDGIYIVKVQASALNFVNVIKASGIEKYCGVTFTDGKINVTTPDDIYTVTMEGETEKVGTFPAPSFHLACSQNSKQIFASLRNTNVDEVVITEIYAGVQTSVLPAGMVKDALGIDFDREGNMYVCGIVSKNIVQLSPYGTRIRQLLTSEDGIGSPRAISVCGDKFVVTSQSSQSCNDINVYQLC